MYFLRTSTYKIFLHSINQFHLNMKLFLLKSTSFFSFLFIAVLASAQVTNVYTTATTWTIPSGVSSISIKVYGGGGGTGGQDCGAGCSNAAAGQVGYVVASYAVSTGNSIGIYPGGKGTNGSNNVTNTGGGAGGADTYAPANYNGGKGGDAGNTGASGGGGGGGAASIVTINSTVRIVAGGAGGGGGMANVANSGQAGVSTVSSNGILNGGNGTKPGGDGGGGGGGGGGSNGSIGGGVYATGGESAGNGGYRGNNAVSGASSITTNGSTAWTNAGRIEITYTIILPVTWLSFTVGTQNNNTLLHWSTASEQNTLDFVIQHSTNTVDWNDIGTVPAAGNSSTPRQYSFTDEGIAAGLHYYRLLQRDIDGNKSFSKIVLLRVADIAGKLKMYPNPVTNGTMTISLQRMATILIYNSTGAKIAVKTLPAGKHAFNVSSFAKGVYYLKVSDEDDAIRFVIQ